MIVGYEWEVRVFFFVSVLPAGVEKIYARIVSVLPVDVEKIYANSSILHRTLLDEMKIYRDSYIEIYPPYPILF